MMNKIGIYVHIPFCESKCIYCDFASYVCKNEIKEKYFKALISEIENCKYKRIVKSIYIGGGTPSLVNPELIGNILNTIRRKFQVEEDAEITIECNPNSTTLDKLKRYFQMGINRLSFGVQSLQDDILKLIGRKHNVQQVLESIDNANKAGFKNISVDLLVGLPNQNIEVLLKDANTLINKNVKHISTYMLQVEENTVLYFKIKNKEITLPSEDESVELYTQLADFLSKKGYQRYEISNFCLENYYSRHNYNYWNMGEYLGFGLGAHSFINNVRFANSRNMNDYFNKKNNFKEKISNKEKIEECIMLGLRSIVGIDIIKLKKLNYDIKNNHYYKKYLKENILIEKGNIAYLNPDYYGVSNSIICDLIP